MRTLPISRAVCSVILAFGCASPSTTPPTQASQVPEQSSLQGIANRDWTLIALGDQSSPTGAGSKPLTLRFDPTTTHVAGFSGCNRYSGSYTLTVDSLRFGPVAYTKMYCASADDIERMYLATLPMIVSYVVTGSTLTLNGAGGPLARFTSSPQ